MRIITGKLRLALRPIQVAEVIEAAVNAVPPAAEAKGLRLEKNQEADSAVISADPDRLQQVIWNLLSNAIKFTPEGGLVRVGIQRNGSCVVITVSDNGQGIESKSPF